MRSVTHVERLTKAVEVAGRRGYVSIPQAAIMLGIHQQTAHSYVNNGVLRHIVVGKRKMVLLDEIDRFKSQGNAHPTT